MRGGSDRNVVPRLEASVTDVRRESCRLLALSEGATSAIAEFADHQGRFSVPASANRGVDTTPIVGRGRRSSAFRVDCARFRCHTVCGSRSADVATVGALEHDLVCDGISPSTVPASSRAVGAARFTSSTQMGATVPAVSQDALEREVGESVGPQRGHESR